MDIRSKSCLVDGCIKNAHRDANGKLGYCCMHYKRFKAHGNPLTVKVTPSPALDWIAEHAGYKGDGCLEWPFAHGEDGYGRVRVARTGSTMTASRFMCVLAHGDSPSPKHEAAHSCGLGHQGCVNPKHLYWATSKENHADKIIHETTNRGERYGLAKLTESDVIKIRQMAAKRIPQKEIAALFGIDQSHVSDIHRRERWGWLD